MEYSKPAVRVSQYNQGGGVRHRGRPKAKEKENIREDTSSGITLWRQWMFYGCIHATSGLGFDSCCLQAGAAHSLKARLHYASFGAICSMRLEARRSMHPRMHQSCACGKAHVVAGAPQLQWESSCNLSYRHIGLVTQLHVFQILYLNSAIIQINRWNIKFIKIIISLHLC